MCNVSHECMRLGGAGTCVSSSIRLHEFTYVCSVYIFMHVFFAHIRTCIVYIPIHTCILYKYTSMQYIHIYMRIYIHVSTYIHAYVYTYTCMLRKHTLIKRACYNPESVRASLLQAGKYFTGRRHVALSRLVAESGCGTANLSAKSETN
jgi:hypothetical protein